MALSYGMRAVCTAKHRKNSKTELQNEILFCNKFLPFRQYLHSGQEDIFLSKKTLSHLFCSLSFPSAIEISRNACRDYYVNGRNPK